MTSGKSGPAAVCPLRSPRNGAVVLRQTRILLAGFWLLFGLFLLSVMAAVRPKRQPLLSEVSAALNNRFLLAVSHGILPRLQDIWFVESNSARSGLGTETTHLVSSLVTAGFPEDMKSTIDSNVNPCRDMYAFACGKFPFKQIPDNTDLMARRGMQKEIETIVTTDQGPAGTYFKSCMDNVSIEAVGDAVLLPWLKYFDSVSDKNSFVRAVAQLNKLNLDTFFTWWIDQDTLDSKQKAMTVLQTGCTLPDDAFYLENSHAMRGYRDVMLEKVTRFFKLVGRTDAAAEAKMVLDFEIEQSRIHVGKTEARQDVGVLTDVNGLEDLMPYWPWRQWFQELGTCTAFPDGSASVCAHNYEEVIRVGQRGGSRLYIRNAHYFSKLNALLERTDMRTLRAVLCWRVMFAWARYMSAPFLDLMVEWDNEMDGTTIKAPRRDKCLQSVSSDVAWPLAKLYIENFFNENNRSYALGMLESIRSRFLQELPHETWMMPEDRKAAESKLMAMFFQVAFPTDKNGKSHWPRQTTVLDGHIQESNFLQNYIFTQKVLADDYIGALGKPIDRMTWGDFAPLEPNAFYSPTQNGLFVSAGILQPPFLRSEPGSVARNFGSIGAILGHEMSHGFDETGRHFDAKGEVHNWWSEETVAKYRNRSKCFASLFDTYHVLGRQVQGENTENEDIADASGLKYAYKAFLHDVTPSALEKRIFFTAYAQMYCNVELKAEALQQVLTDTHAPSKFRVIGALSQFEPFAEAFGCPSGSPMAPHDRCSLW